MRVNALVSNMRGRVRWSHPPAAKAAGKRGVVDRLRWPWDSPCWHSHPCEILSPEIWVVGPVTSSSPRDGFHRRQFFYKPEWGWFWGDSSLLHLLYILFLLLHQLHLRSSSIRSQMSGTPVITHGMWHGNRITCTWLCCMRLHCPSC